MGPTAPWESLGDRVKQGFDRFWHPRKQYCYDVLDGPTAFDDALRPNQIFAVSLPYTMLSPERARSVVEKARQHLLTPYGLRSLAARDPQYRGRYRGGPIERDGAYHQGTVWAWLMGPFITAYLKVNGASDAARRQALQHRCRGTFRSLLPKWHRVNKSSSSRTVQESPAAEGESPVSERERERAGT